MSYSIGLNSIYTGSTANNANRWTACNFYDKVILACNTSPLLFWPGYNQAVQVPGIDPAIRFEGITAIGPYLIGWYGSTYKWSASADYSTWIPVSETVSKVRCTISTAITQVAAGSSMQFFLNEDPTGWTVDQFIRIDYFTSTSFYQITAVDPIGFSVTATALALTGSISAGTVIPISTEINSIPANDSGETINSGDLINGPILAIVPQGDTGIIFKARSIQMIQGSQYGSLTSGVFQSRQVITDEGMLGKYSWCRSTDEVIYFLGNRELYAYSGGQDLRPVAVQHTKQVFAELNYAEADSIIMYHYEQNNEIWVVYPVFGNQVVPRRVLIYNYRWDTCTIDDYDQSLGAITAVGSWDYQVKTSWAQLTNTWATLPYAWEDVDALNQAQRLTVIGMTPDPGTPSINVYGLNYDRNGSSYICTCESQDYDFGDNLAFKYVDTIYCALQVLTKLINGPFKLFFQVGARDNLDSDIRWSTPDSLEVSGNGNFVNNVQIRASGRYIRVRLYSNQVGVQWKVSSFKILARMGGTY